MKKEQNPIKQNIKKPLFSLSSNATVNISLWQLIFQPMKLIFTNWHSFFLLAVPTAMILTASSLLSGHAVVCGTSAMIGVSTYACDGPITTYYIDLLFRIILTMIFAIKWYQFALLKTNFTFKNLFSLHKFEAKALGFLCLIDIANIAPIIAIVILTFHTPDPNWKVELAFFTSVAWMFLLPFLAIRFYPYIGLATEKQKIPNISFLWNKTKGNMIKFLIGISILVFLALFMFMQYYAFIQLAYSFTSIETASVEFEYNIIIILFLIGFINFCYIQKKLLFEGDTNEK